MGRRITSDRETFYWTLNQAAVYCEKIEGNVLHLACDTVTPNFSHYQICYDGTLFKDSVHGRFLWTLHVGQNSLVVCPVNKFGVKGVCSAVRINAEAF